MNNAVLPVSKDARRVSSCTTRGGSLEPAKRTGLAVDMAEALPLLAVLQQTGGSHDHDNIDTNHSEHSGENVVDENVGEGRDGCRTPAHEGRSCRARAHGICPEERRCAVEIATAVELDIGIKVSTYTQTRQTNVLGI